MLRQRLLDYVIHIDQLVKLVEQSEIEGSEPHGKGHSITVGKRHLLPSGERD